MKTIGKFTLLAGLAVFSLPSVARAETCKTADPFPFETQYAIEQCPDDIQALFDRMNSCAHFAGEEASDDERRAFLDNAMKENRCADIGCDFQKIFEAYEGDIAYTGVLFEYAAVVYGSDENIPACSR